jgi:beta-N-acetylhexosaminidase
MALGAIAAGEGVDIGEQMAERQGAVQARELRSVGVNWDFAPVVDVNNNPDNPIIGVRSYGEDPDMVGRLGAAAVSGLQNGGVLACAKHFPGHGDTSVDSHLALPKVSGDLERLYSVELAPFRQVIAGGVGSIMTAHIMFPDIDADRPATISNAVLTGLLKEQMGYDGIIITDCLEMSAIADGIGTTRGAVESLKAGADMVLICHTFEKQRETRNAIIDAVKSKEMPEARLTEAVGKVLAAKQKVHDKSADGYDWDEQAVNDFEAELASRSITIVRATGAIPLQLRPGGTITVLSAHSAVHGVCGEFVERGLKARGYPLSTEITDSDLQSAEEIARNARSQKQPMIVLTTPREPWGEGAIDQDRQALLVRRLLKVFGPDLIVVALREPYDLRGFPEVANYVCTYGYRKCSLKAVVEVLLGEFTPTGRMPVAIPR